MDKSTYLVALGSNVRHHRYGDPRAVIGAALARMAMADMKVKRVSRIMATRPVGPSRRRFANAAALVSTRADPPELLARLQRIEAEFGRRKAGQRWRARVLDLDIVLWSGGVWTSPGLVIPHPAFRERTFVLKPTREVAADWRDPVSGRTVRQLHATLTKPGAPPR